MTLTKRVVVFTSFITIREAHTGIYSSPTANLIFFQLPHAAHQERASAPGANRTRRPMINFVTPRTA